MNFDLKIKSLIDRNKALVGNEEYTFNAYKVLQVRNSPFVLILSSYLIQND